MISDFLFRKCPWSRTAAPRSLLFGLLSVGPAFAGVAESWDYRPGAASLGDWKSVWVPESDAASDSRALRIEAAPGQKEQALVLEDIYDSRARGGDDAAGTPSISRGFAPVGCGSLTLRAGTGGSQNQQAVITLLAKGRPLLLVKLVNNTTGQVISASGAAAFSDESWFNKARDYEIKWERRPDGGHAVTVVFHPLDKQPVVFGPLRFLSPGDPDQIRLQVGYGSATAKSLRIEQLTLSSCN